MNGFSFDGNKAYLGDGGRTGSLFILFVTLGVGCDRCVAVGALRFEH